MDGPRDDHTQRSKSDRERQMPSLVCGFKHMTQMNLPTKQKQTHREQTHGCQGGVGQVKDGVGVWK